MFPRPVLGIVAACGPEVGSGHLARSLALAEAWRAAGGDVRLSAAGPLDPTWAERFRDAGVEVDSGDALTPPSAAASIWVVDGYRIGGAVVTDLARRGPVAIIDDGGERGQVEPEVAWIVDQNLGATEGDYPHRPPSCRLLLGVRHAMVRKDVAAAHPAVPPDRDASPRRLLVAMGGDPAPTVRALFDAAATPELLSDLGLKRVDLVGVRDVGAVLGEVDLALTAAGSTVWELCCAAVPAVAVVVADNQRVVARRAGAAGLVRDAGDLDSVSPDALRDELRALVADRERRRRLAAAGWAAVDGRGAERVATALRGGLLGLRRADVADEALLWQWANDPAVRAAAFDPTPIPLADHRRWLASRLKDPQVRVWIASLPDGAPLGVVRLEAGRAGVGGGGALLDYSVALEHRGTGWASAMLDAAARVAADDHSSGWADWEWIEARVLPGNDASCRALVRADFVLGPDGSAGDRRWHTYTRPRHG